VGSASSGSVGSGSLGGTSAGNSDLGTFKSVRGWIAVGGQQIVAIDPDHPSLRKVIFPEPGLPMAWSRDGSELLIQTGDWPNYLYEVLWGDGPLVRVAGPGGAVQRAWLSPDGAEVRYWDSVNPFALMGVDVRGGTPHVIARFPTPIASDYPDLSPDGTRIAFTSILTRALSTMNVDGSHRRRILDDRQGSGHFNDAEFYAAAWSPDGRRMALNGFAGGGTILVNADGADLAHATRLPRSGAVSWSPDGSRIAIWDVAHLLVMNADGTHVRSIHLARVRRSGSLGWPLWMAWNPMTPASSSSPLLPN